MAMAMANTCYGIVGNSANGYDMPAINGMPGVMSGYQDLRGTERLRARYAIDASLPVPNSEK